MRLTASQVMARMALWATAVFALVSLALRILGTLHIGLPDLQVLGNEFSSASAFEAYAAEYLRWGAWGDLTSALTFGSLLLAVPFLPHASRPRPLLVAGAVLGLIAELMDLSQITGLEVASLGLESGNMSEFSAGMMFRYGMDTASAYVWIAGLLVFSIGLAFFAGDTPNRRLRLLTYVLGGAMFADAVLVGFAVAFSGGRAPLHAFASAFSTLVLVLWALSTSMNVTRRPSIMP